MNFGRAALARRGARARPRARRCACRRRPSRSARRRPGRSRRSARRPGRSGASAITTSPGSSSVLQTRSMTCWPPVVTSRSSASTRMPSAAITSTMQALTSAMPSVGPVLQRLGQPLGGDALHDRGERAGRERARVGQPAGQRDDLGPLRDRHQVAHRGGLHDLRARGEQPGVALELVLGGRPAPVPLRSRRSRPYGHRAFDILQAARHRRRRRHPALPARAARRRARGRRPRRRLRRHRLRVPRGGAVPAGACSSASSRSTSLRRRAGDATLDDALGVC